MVEKGRKGKIGQGRGTVRKRDKERRKKRERKEKRGNDREGCGEVAKSRKE